jgi:hypothetical protein
MKKLLFMLLAINAGACLANVQTNNPGINSATLVGGWYPVFFNSYSNNKIKQLIEQINSGNVAKMIITYDKNSSLAQQIQSEIATKTSFPVQMDFAPVFDGSVKYNHKQVIVTVFNRIKQGE